MTGFPVLAAARGSGVGRGARRPAEAAATIP